MKACSLAMMIWGLAVLLVTPGFAQNDFGDIGKELPVVTPNSPAQSQAMLQVQDGFRMELVAAEPLVHDPVAVAFDEDGKMYVVELPPYNSYVVDGFATKGSIRVLEDTDDDGVSHSDCVLGWRRVCRRRSGSALPERHHGRWQSQPANCHLHGVRYGQGGRGASQFDSLGTRSSVSFFDKPQRRQREGG